MRRALAAFLRRLADRIHDDEESPDPMPVCHWTPTDLDNWQERGERAARCDWPRAQAVGTADGFDCRGRRYL